ncbi:MAG: DUF4440 domain-containing protein [Myxococcaceae bacterium]
MTGCAHRQIPGTDIDDNDDTRSIIGVMMQYKSAMEARDANAVIALASESFHDEGGTGTPADDLDYKGLRDVLPKRLAKVDELKLEMTVKKIVVNEQDDTALATYYFNTTFRIPTLTNKIQNESGIKQMELKKVGGQWKLLSGI